MVKIRPSYGLFMDLHSLDCCLGDQGLFHQHHMVLRIIGLKNGDAAIYLH